MMKFRLHIAAVAATAGLICLAVIVLLPPAGRIAAAIPPHNDKRPAPQMMRDSESKPETAFMFLLGCLTRFDERQLPAALAACNQAVQADRKNASAFRLRGTVYGAMGEYDRATADLSYAIGLEPGDAESFRVRASIFVVRRSFEPALADFRTAIALEPDNPATYKMRGLSFEVMGKFGPAIADFGSVIRLAPLNADGWNSRCWIRAVTGRGLASALSDCNRAVKLAPDSASVLDSRGLVFLKMEKFTLAIRDYNAALALEPKLASSLYGRGVAERWLGRTKAGNRDIAVAKALESGIEKQFKSYGVSLRRAVRRPSLATQTPSVF